MIAPAHLEQFCEILSIALAIVCSFLVPVTGFMALFAGMAMDAPGSEKSIWKWLFVFSMMAAPFALLGAAFFACIKKLSFPEQLRHSCRSRR